MSKFAYDAAVTIVNRLDSVAFREFGRIYGVKDELERLKSTVQSISSVLLDAEDQQEKSYAVQIWIRRLKHDVLHPADDLLDEFVIQDMRHKMDKPPKNKVTQVLHSFSPNRIAFRRKMAHEIENIQKKLNDVVRDMSMLNLNPNVVVFEQSDNMRRETCSYVLESDIIGREDDKKKIISLLRQPNGNQNVSVVAIVGIGGLGKTALAQLVYNDSEVTKFFDKSMWVCVSDNFDVKTIVKKMLELLSDTKIDDMLSLENLQNMLRENLAGKRYLLVLDAIWNESYEKWAQLRTYLMCGSQDSKIIVTTCTKIVAQTMGVSDPYTLNGLTKEQSWHLLENIITYRDESKRVNQTLELIGKKIAEKCSGLPLAIRTLGGLLQGKREEREWFDLLQGDFWKLCEDEESIMPVLKLSYQNFSPQLRQCFAYCALYPKDWEIQKDELIQLWMAQGYVECSIEGNQLVNILLMKSFLQDATSDVDDEIFSFKMHDLIHDLAIYVAENDCCYLDSGTERLVGSPVHLMLESDAIGLLESVDTSKLRTLILLSNRSKSINENELFVISKFKYLRALKLSHSSLSKLSGSIEKLKHLRYLNLSHCTGLGSLFKSISILVLLQTLILMPDEKVELSTMAFSKLINLRQLQISDWDAFEEKNPAGFGKLSVQQFKGIIYSNQSSLPQQYRGISFSNWLFPLSNIVEISLFLCGSFRHLPPMERQPFLKSLHISYLEELEYIYYEDAFPLTFFPSLENLTIWFCGKLKGWSRMLDDFNHPNSSHHLSLPPFPRLSQLSIIGCQMFTQMPTFPNLKSRLELFDSSGEILQATLSMVALECSDDSPPLSMLKSLHIDGVGLDLKKIPKDWMQNFTSLQHLQINWFTCEIFEEISLWFKDRHNCLPSLQTLGFHNCEDLEALPDWICNLSLLTHLSMYDCTNLASVPEGMLRLSNLQTLEIIGCPILIEECETQKSKVWTKIAHIPEIILK